MRRIIYSIITLLVLISCTEKASKNIDALTSNDISIDLEEKIDTLIANSIFLKEKDKPEQSLRGEYYYDIGNKLFEIIDYQNSIDSYLLSIKYSYSKLYFSYYNISCAYSLLNQVNDSMDYLKLALDNGYVFYDHINNDEDLINTRKSIEYNALMKQYTYMLCYQTIKEHSFSKDRYVLFNDTISHIDGINIDSIIRIEESEYNRIAESNRPYFEDSYLDITYLRLTYNGLNKIVKLESITDYRASTGILRTILQFDDKGYINNINEKSITKKTMTVNRIDDILHIYGTYSYGGVPDVDGVFQSFYLLSKNGELIEKSICGYEKITQSDGNVYYDIIRMR
ncbi:MAG TPA: hypothetical protein GXZ90_06930 [Clostridiales bacterium]|nr:hypothetical protein [Clostridiales bacterium]